MVSDNSTDRTVELARSRPGWEVWETVGNTGKKGGALNQAFERLEPELTEHDYVVTMDADTILDTAFVKCAHAKFREQRPRATRSGASARTSPGCRSTPPWARCR